MKSGEKKLKPLKWSGVLSSLKLWLCDAEGCGVVFFFLCLCSKLSSFEKFCCYLLSSAQKKTVSIL